MSNLELWSLVVGFFLPLVQSVIQQSHWPQHIRAGVNFAACAVVAVGVSYFEGNVNLHDWVRSGLLVLVATIATYHGLWKPTVAPAIERHTNTRAP